MPASMKRVEAAAKIIRDTYHHRGLRPYQMAQDVLDADDAAREIEYEYAVEETHAKNGDKTIVPFIREWTDHKEIAVKRCKDLREEDYVDAYGNPVYTYVVVRREKPKDYEIVEE